MLAGVDEVGRGPLAGPVVAAAVILKAPIAGLKDSKKLSPKRREQLAVQIQQEALAFAFGRAEVEEIDALNIHHATLLAMKRAIEALPIQPSSVKIDGLFIPPGLSVPCQAIVNGDNLIAEICAASIIAKVLRDAYMQELDNLYPGYDFAAHKGYATEKHRQALKILGPCPIHRMSFMRKEASVDC